MRAHHSNALASPACDIPPYVRSQHRFTKKQNYEKKRNPRKPERKAKNPRAGAKPGFQLLPPSGRDGSKEMATEAKLEANGRTLFSKTIGIIVVLAR